MSVTDHSSFFYIIGVPVDLLRVPKDFIVLASDPSVDDIRIHATTFDKGRVGGERGADISSLRWQAHSTFVAGSVLFIVCNPGHTHLGACAGILLLQKCIVGK